MMSGKVKMVMAQLVLAGSLASSASAQSPAIIPIQGFLTDTAGSPIDGNHRMDFFIYDDETDTSNQVFSETHANVSVSQGYFVVYLGTVGTLDLASFRDYGELWVEMQIDSAEIVQPRTRLASVPYAGFAQYCAESAHAVSADTASSADDATTLDGQTRAEVVAERPPCPAGMERIADYCIEPTPSLAGSYTWLAAVNHCLDAGRRICSQTEVLNAVVAGVVEQVPFASGNRWYTTGSLTEATLGQQGESTVCEVQGNNDETNYPRYSTQCQHGTASSPRFVVCCY